MMLKKIVIIGPESTGKSSLCNLLALHYNTTWVKEFAREYLLKNGSAYTFQDLLTIAKGQIEKEQIAVDNLQQLNKNILINKHQPIFLDTDMYVMKVWCEFVFDNCHQWILNQIVSNTYDLYLLCDIDLPWVKDELREYPDLKTRAKLYHQYKDIMINQTTPWVNISGNYEERLKKAITAVDKILK